jgi:5-methylcytosine-specific restriction endonuclease McrA
MKRTLVLNSDHRPLCCWPLSLIPAQEAVHALYRDRCYVVEDWPGAFFHSPSVTIPVPKVVALRNYAHVSATPKFCRRSILLRDRYRCQYCGKQFQSEDLTFDHYVPRAAGGETRWTNILTACIPCNTLKGSRQDMRPLKEPKRPTSAELLRAGLEFLPNDVREDWGSYLYWMVDLER